MRYGRRLLSNARQDVAAGQVFNIAFGGRVTLLELCETIAKALDREDVRPVFGPERKGDIRHSNADIGKARRLLGYAPEWDFGRGMIEAIEWYKGVSIDG